MKGSALKFLQYYYKHYNKSRKPKKKLSLNSRKTFLFFRVFKSFSQWMLFSSCERKKKKKNECAIKVHKTKPRKKPRKSFRLGQNYF